MNQNLTSVIVRTVAYADIFDYPLKKTELFKYLLGNFKPTRFKLPSQVAVKNSYYFLKGRDKIIKTRLDRERWSQKKIDLAKKTARQLRFIPWIKLIGVTGALAMNNAEENDDVDLLIVTIANRLWLTRLLVVMIIEISGRRRRPGDRQVKDKICLNMFLDENHLKVPLKEQDLYSAHEVCQLKPLEDKNNTYQKFINQNQWVKKYLPNWRP